MDAGEIAAIVAAALASVTAAITAARWACSRWQRSRSRSTAPIAIRFGEAIHYGPMSGIWVAAPEYLSKTLDPESSFRTLKQQEQVSFLEYTPFSLWLSNTSKRERNVVRLREVWLSVQDFLPLDLASEQQPLAVNVTTVAAGGRGAELALGGTICTIESIRVPLLASASASDQLGSFHVHLKGEDDYEIELTLAAVEPGRYAVRLCLELEWRGETYFEEVDQRLTVLACDNLDWARGFFHSFAWQSLTRIEACPRSTFPADWQDWCRRWGPVPSDARFFTPFASGS